MIPFRKLLTIKEVGQCGNMTDACIHFSPDVSFIVQRIVSTPFLLYTTFSMASLWSCTFVWYMWYQKENKQLYEPLE